MKKDSKLLLIMAPNWYPSLKVVQVSCPVYLENLVILLMHIWINMTTYFKWVTSIVRCQNKSCKYFVILMV